MAKEQKQQKVVVKQDEENPEPVEILAKSIVDVAQAAQKLYASPLKMDTIVLLLQDSIGARNITQKQIRLVLAHAANLKSQYLK